MVALNLIGVTFFNTYNNCLFYCHGFFYHTDPLRARIVVKFQREPSNHIHFQLNFNENIRINIMTFDQLMNTLIGG